MKYNLIIFLSCCSLYSEYYIEQAHKLVKEQKFANAIEIYKKAIQTNPNSAAIYFNLGYVYQLLKNFDAALENFDKAISIDYKYTKAYLYKAILLRKMQNKYLEEFLKKALRINPNSIDLYLLYMQTLYDSSRFKEALVIGHKALKINPDNTKLLLILGDILSALSDTSSALDIFLKVLKIDPVNSTAYSKIGSLLKIENKYIEAIEYYNRWMNSAPENPAAHVGLGEALCAIGDLYHGWEEFQWRFRSANNKKFDPIFKSQFKLKLYIKEFKNLKDKKILLRAHFGFGDMIQYLRYAKLLKNYGAEITLLAPLPIKNLFALPEYIDKVIVDFSEGYCFDFDAFLINLPWIFDINIMNIPNQPYLNADSKLLQYWKNYFKNDDNLKVGLCWKAGEQTLEKSEPLTKRSIPPKYLAPLATLKNISFYSLQKDNDITELPHELKIKSFGKDFDNKYGAFMDSAAIIKNLDLVITVDTSIAHLAGALGAKVWMLLPFSSEWRWMQGRSDTPWYPTMKIFRQSTSGNWESVISAITVSLKNV